MMETYRKEDIRRGDIYYADLRPVVDSEQGGIRPVVILQNNVGNRHSPTVIAAAITSRKGKHKLPTHVNLDAPVPGLYRDSRQLEDYLYSGESDRVCLVFDLRRTGKTTMLRQAIARMNKEDLSRTTYIKARRSDTMVMMNRDLKKLFDAGFRYVFIDEVTLMRDFIDSAALFSDVFAAMGMKIVLSGTDSLGFWLAMDQELYDRAKPIHTIVLLETMKAADRGHRVFKLQFAAGEFDMVIYHEKENCCEIFEIKHSDKQVPAQYRHLADQEKCDKTERRFGPIRGRYVLYRGEDAALENGVQYRNVERYLNDLPEMDITPVQETGIQQIGPVL